MTNVTLILFYFKFLTIIAKISLVISLPWLLYPSVIYQQLFQPCLPRYLHNPKHMGQFVNFFWLHLQMGRDYVIAMTYDTLNFVLLLILESFTFET